MSSVRVEKQEFGLREKLTELDYGKLPYHKMPMGTILQVRQSQSSSNLTISSASYTNLRELTIHPISRNSLMYIRTNCQPRFQMTGNSRGRFLNRIVRMILILIKKQHCLIIMSHLNIEIVILIVVVSRYVEVQLLVKFVIGIVKLKVYVVQMMVFYRTNCNILKKSLKLRPGPAPAAGKPASAAWTSRSARKILALAKQL